MDALHGSAQRPLTTAELTAREDFELGKATVSPSSRRISGPGGSREVEPRVMQVLVVLADAAGGVVTRETLFERCWGPIYVGDDSLNRTVGVIRKLASEIADESFAVETVRGAGYTLTIATEASAGEAQVPSLAGASSRRRFVAAGVAASAVAAGIGWIAFRPGSDPRFDALMERGSDALRLDDPSSARYFEQAVALEPRDAKAWGLLAYSLASGVFGGIPVTDRAAQAIERAARRAIEIDPNESNALLALTFIQSDTLDWLEREQHLRKILDIDPQNPRVMRSLGSFLHGVGRCADSLTIVEQALALEPLAPDHWLRKAMRLWVLGRPAEADPIIDRALQFWPTHPLVRLARLMIYAFTGRARAALAMIEEEERNPIFVSAAAIPVWRASLLALETTTLSTKAAARSANVEGSVGSPQIAAWAILVMSVLGELDAAFDIANGFLLDRGSVIVRPRPDPRLPRVNGAGWRNTFGLFTPPTKAMRLDPRFHTLADGLGLVDYWRRRGIGPDAFLFKA